jgi:hypothetical protein
VQSVTATRVRFFRFLAPTTKNWKRNFSLPADYTRRKNTICLLKKDKKENGETIERKPQLSAVWPMPRRRFPNNFCDSVPFGDFLLKFSLVLREKSTEHPLQSNPGRDNLKII